MEGELERNPLLERHRTSSEAPVDGASLTLRRSMMRTTASDLTAMLADSRPDEWLSRDLVAAATIEQTLDSGLGERLFRRCPPRPRRAASQAPRRRSTPSGAAARRQRTASYNLEAFVASGATLAEPSCRTARARAFPKPAQRLIGQYLIDLVDDAGYLPAISGDAADRLGATADQVTDVLGVLHTFDPPGVCCAQSSPNAWRSSCASTIVSILRCKRLWKISTLLAKRDVAALRKLCGVDDDDLADMIAEIRRLNPKPGLKFATARMQTVVPDVYVRPGPDGGWLVELNSDTLPKVLVNQTYYSQLSKNVRKGEDKILSCGMPAERDMARSAHSISAQAPFSRSRPRSCVSRTASSRMASQHLRPLNLKTVADAIQMHESTVSRVTANKYMATNRGIFELKYFFTASIASADGGEAHSAEAVRHHIRS